MRTLALLKVGQNRIYSVYYRLFDSFPAKNIVYTLCMVLANPSNSPQTLLVYVHLSVGEFRKLEHIYVFITTALWSVWAYIWMFIVLAVSTE